MCDIILSEIDALCAELTIEYDESHDVNHHREVKNNVVRILQNMPDVSNKTAFMAQVAALIHDIVDRKYHVNIEYKRGRILTFLTASEARLIGYDEFAANIMWIIDNMSYSKEHKEGRPIHPDKHVLMARHIAADADRMEALGPIGIRRCVTYTRHTATKRGQILTPGQLMEIVITYCREKLLTLHSQYIYTPAAQSLSVDRHYYIIEFVKLWDNGFD
jgi:uncharacterized protein